MANYKVIGNLLEVDASKVTAEEIKIISDQHGIPMIKGKLIGLRRKPPATIENLKTSGADTENYSTIVIYDLTSKKPIKLADL